MSYFKPYIDETGFHYPTYNEILEALIDDMQTIYGAGVYLGSDSQDYEMLSKIAEKIYDTYQTDELVYNSFSPVTAIGTGLDYVVAINGIQRKQATKSVAVLVLTGSAGTAINNGFVTDVNGNVWDLPEQVVIEDNGTVEVTATCRETGVIEAGPHTITHIMTPVAGWESVDNDAAATTGTVTEMDSQLRARQADSVALPAQSLKEGMRAGLRYIQNVSRCEVYENDTNVMDDNGIPAHSICCVVEGGSDADIAETIRLRKGNGCGTFGTESVTVKDNSGQDLVIQFTRLIHVPVNIEIRITTRAGYKASIPDEIKGAIIEYLDKFSIGTDLTVSIIWMVAQTINADLTTPTFSISSVKAARHGDDLSLEDVIINYNEVAKATDLTINVIVE